LENEQEGQREITQTLALERDNYKSKYEAVSNKLIERNSVIERIETEVFVD
jgi:hypothetical protein